MTTTTHPRVRAALALAGLATTLFAAGCGEDTADGDSGAPAGSATSGSPTASETPQPPTLGEPLDTRDLPRGKAPAIDWIEGQTLHTPDGDVTLRGNYFDVVRYDDGWLALSADNDGYLATRLDTDGTVVGEPVETSDRIATSADGSQVLWVDGRTLTIHDNTTGDDTAIGDGHRRTRPVAVVDGVAYYNVAVDGDWQLDGRWWEGTEHDPQPGAPQPYADASVDGATTALSSVDDYGSCSTVRSPHGDSLGETCDFTLDEFSPDGAHLLAGPAYRDGFGDGELAVLPAKDGAITQDAALLHYTRDGDADPFFLYSTWEDDTHLLVVTFTPDPGSAKGTWQIIRIGLDGSVEDAVAPVTAADLDGPFRLA